VIRFVTSFVGAIFTMVTMAALFGALTGLVVLAVRDPQLRDISFWTLGGLTGATWRAVILVGVVALPALALLWRRGPGLDALAYRVGTHAAFLETMKARLSGFWLEVPREELGPDGKPIVDRIYPLRGLTTREGNDPAIALLDAWSVAADVLTFYRERLSQEAYLRTATDEVSLGHY